VSRSSSVADCLPQKPAAGVPQSLSNNSSDYESAWEDEDVEHFTADGREDISGHQLVDFLGEFKGQRSFRRTRHFL
jgi:hypothetical protein